MRFATEEQAANRKWQTANRCIDGYMLRAMRSSRKRGMVVRGLEEGRREYRREILRGRSRRT